VRAFEQAEAQGLRRIALTGAAGGTLGRWPTWRSACRARRVALQECHIAIGQLLAFMVEEMLYPNP